MANVPISDEALEEIVARVRNKFSMKPKVAIAGFGKSGKSSLFNAIYGERIARVSMRTDETSELKTAERFGVDFTDTPGIGTATFSLERVIEMGILDKQHVVLHVLNGTAAISADDQRLHQEIERSMSRRLTVVNKLDLLEPHERHEFAQSVSEKLGLGSDDFLFVSAKHGTHVNKLVQRITDVLPQAMQDAFVAQQQADIALKERRIRGLVYSKATICAAIAAVPIPIADIFVITPIQIAMVTAIGYFHGVEVGRERVVELITTLGAGIGLREAARQLIRLVPGYGTAVSAAIAFAGTVALGEAANLWFKGKMKLNPEELRSVFSRVAERARDAYAQQERSARAITAQVEALKRQWNDGEITSEEFERRVAELAGEVVIEDPAELKD